MNKDMQTSKYIKGLSFEVCRLFSSKFGAKSEIFAPRMFMFHCNKNHTIVLEKNVLMFYLSKLVEMGMQGTIQFHNN